MSARPAPLRAFEIFSTLPAGCRLELVTNDYNSPHLKPGEFAVVDTSDREFAEGEVYAIRWPSGRGNPKAICQLRSRQHNGVGGVPFTGIWFCPLAKPRYLASGEIDWDGPVHMSDGPLKPECLPQYIVGRVLGVYEAADVLAPLEPRRLIG